MKVFGITGGVGAGKSEVLTYLGQNYDATVIQADEAGYLVMLPGGECYGEIVKLFGRQITTETGELDRKRIAEIVFQDEEKLKALNAIVHPAVKRYIKKAIAAAEKAGTEYVFVEAALLIEEKYDEIEIVVQINGKIKDKLMIPAGLDKDGTQEAAMNTEKIKGLIEGKNVVKVIAVPGKLVNIVVK